MLRRYDANPAQAGFFFHRAVHCWKPFTQRRSNDLRFPAAPRGNDRVAQALPTHDQQIAFLSHKPLSGVALEHNDFVRVVNSEHEGDSGSLVSIEELGADPVYLIELESNQDALIPQSYLQRVKT